MSVLNNFREVWLLDFEFHAPDGYRPDPLCMVALERRSGRILSLKQNDLRRLAAAPFSTDADTLVVAYYAAAEMSCFLALGWPLPEYVIDLYAEFRCLTSGLAVPSGHGLLGAAVYFGLDPVSAAPKENMRGLAMRGGPFTAEEEAALLDYCRSDVKALGHLLTAMESRLGPHAVLRGRYVKSVAAMERRGIPLDVPFFQKLMAGWETIRSELVGEVDAGFGFYEGSSFRIKRFAAWLRERHYSWPLLESGQLALDADTFGDMADVYPELRQHAELRRTLGQMREQDLAIGPDGRNRCMLSPFGSCTGRNQPSTSHSIFGMPAWLRSLIRPSPGHALAYVDWSQQEFGIAAALSGDEVMQQAYLSGDPYLGFGRIAGLVPAGATKKSHPHQREICKVVALAVQYGMGVKTLALRLQQSEPHARSLLELHRRSFTKFWKWSDAATDYGLLNGNIFTTMGWVLHVTAKTKLGTLRNFPMQANGAELMRLACCLAMERGVRVCCPVHDALLIEAPGNDIEDAVTATQDAMLEAGKILLGGFPLASEAKVFRYPDRLVDRRGVKMWERVSRLLSRETTPATHGTTPLPRVAPPPVLSRVLSMNTAGPYEC